MTLAALIFDVDGTIAQTERDGHRVAFNRAFAEAGLDWQWSVEHYGELLEVPGGKERIRHYWQQEHPEFVPPIPATDWIAQLHQRKNHYYRDCITQDLIPLRPGVRRLMMEAKTEGVRLAIATTSALPNAMALLEHHLDPAWFEVIAAGDIVPQKKPAPDIYQYVLAQMNLPPEQCLVFEDSAPGLIAATAAELTTVVTVNDYTQHQNFQSARLVVSELGEPGKPGHVLQGEPLAAGYFDLAAARSLLSDRA